jgi:hypothetical protein
VEFDIHNFKFHSILIEVKNKSYILPIIDNDNVINEIINKKDGFNTYTL